MSKKIEELEQKLENATSLEHAVSVLEKSIHRSEICGLSLSPYLCLSQ